MTSVPPLLCSTPPPIEYEENENDEDSGLATTLTLEDEDDIFGEYALPHGTVNIQDPSSLPPSLIQSDLESSTSSGFTETPPVIDKHNNNNLSDKYESINAAMKCKEQETEKFTTLAEAYNYDISETHKSQETVISENVLPANTIEVNASSNLNENTNDNEAPRDSNQKFSFDISSEINKLNAHEMQLLSAQTKVDAVILEDIPDDFSDDEMHSPKNIIYEDDDKFNNNSSEFFSIHAVENMNNLSNENITTMTSPTEIIITTTTETVSVSSVENADLKIDDDDDDFSEFSTFEKTKEKILEQKNFNNNEVTANDLSFEADFTQFKFESDYVEDIPETTETTIKDIKTVCPTTDVAALEDDDFDDFQDFSSACDSDKLNDDKVASIELETKINAESNLPSIKVPRESHDDHKNNRNDDDNNDDDDEFGNFTEATVSSVTSDIKQKPVQQMNLANFHERVKNILETMFPIDPANVDNIDDLTDIQPIEKNENILNLGSPDTARALEFQWTGSETRNALIRALGIDTRNILFGENWNPSMPRYAANLSCNPLKPMKSQSTSNNAATCAENYSTDNAAVERKQHQADQDSDFDWNNSSLANPFDGSKEILQTREIEKIQSASAIADESAQQQEKQSSVDENGITSSSNNNNNNKTIDEITTTTATTTAIDSTTTTSTGISKTATTTLSTTLSTDSISNSRDNNNLQTINIADLQAVENSIKLNASNVEMPEHVIDLHDIISKPSDKNIITSTNSHDIAQHEPNNKDDDDADDDDNEVITTSTYAGPLKETHIYTPPRADGARVVRTTPVNPTNSPSVINKGEPVIDFDYEKAAAGIIIDETVVKKEYRDVEYNPSFGIDYNSTNSMNKCLSNLDDKPQLDNVLNTTTATTTPITEFDDDFTEFQSVPAPAIQTINNSIANTTTSLQHNKSIIMQNSRTSTPIFNDEMILSPAVLLPQSVSMINNKQKPKIEWGERATSINPDELARIEEIFAQTKLHKTKEPIITTATTTIIITTTTTTTSINNSPKHHVTATTTTTVTNATNHHNYNSPLTISATISMKEQIGNTIDDEDWSDFVSVPVVTKLPLNRNEQYINYNNTYTNNNSKSMRNINDNNNHNNDDDWSDFVSSSPATSLNKEQKFQAQFNNNSSVWQNANFYNNPLSFYHAPQQQNNMLFAQKLQQHNMHNNNFKENRNEVVKQQQQQVHILQDFSTAPQQSVQPQSVQQQQGKLTGSISLIPDLGFVAPTSYVNALPKTTFSMKK